MESRRLNYVPDKIPDPKKIPEGAEPVFQDVGESDHGIHYGLEERKEMTPEKRERYDWQMTKLTSMMNESGAWWQLHGGNTIDVVQIEKGGDYVGRHADIDVFVLRKDVEKLEEFFRAKGYGLFLKLWTEDRSRRVFRRVSAKDYRRGQGGLPHVLEIDERGRAKKDEDQLWKIQMDPIDIAEDGSMVDIFDEAGHLPKEWTEGRTVNFHGQEMHICHPARYLAYKIRSEERGYHDKDIDRLANLGVLTLQDVDDLEDVALTRLDKEQDEEKRAIVTRRLQRIRQIIQRNEQGA
ncbi:MAG: hypothetical protein COU11_01965 [Candidatus Harrisonbacteria bacterium CG10_big_fil_rev_8_21_14_0_10_49_15]|uniref:Uncharacterized protein n=1 Tax=Candidatus Harrisonbacteria bacterium CG10_big_fil_rev_8_21_14_0_10_49_15 TaxID=1974587 RepID=A0A2H0UL74_9BACT|nr:MAG: hypothetical protein COU11_01965 [Candidatus Harrisonbacteria bacterium CG10_big_fil_rev_8_21_14_0_10_49_15]